MKLQCVAIAIQPLTLGPVARKTRVLCCHLVDFHECEVLLILRLTNQSAMVRGHDEEEPRVSVLIPDGAYSLI